MTMTMTAKKKKYCENVHAKGHGRFLSYTLHSGSIPKFIGTEETTILSHRLR